MPTNDTTFAYDQLMGFMRKRAAEAGIIMEQDLYLIVISFNNIFDGSDFDHERQFWDDPAHKPLGKLINWPLGLSGVVPPQVYPEFLRPSLSLTDLVWGVD